MTRHSPKGRGLQFIARTAKLSKPSFNFFIPDGDSLAELNPAATTPAPAAATVFKNALRLVATGKLSLCINSILLFHFGNRLEVWPFFLPHAFEITQQIQNLILAELIQQSRRHW